MLTALLVIAVIVVLWFALRVRLNPVPNRIAVPETSNLTELQSWLNQREAEVPGLIEGTAAHISFHDEDSPAPTPICFLYVHGFSATWPETAPVTEHLASRNGANVMQARLAGHGLGPEGMETPAEAWLTSLDMSWQIARQLGERVVIVATSTGVPLSIWLTSQPEVSTRVAALLCMSPNFGIHSRYDFLLTAPFSRYWIHYAVGAEQAWDPMNEAQAKAWTYRYSTRALIEMQKVVDWVRRQNLGARNVPMAMMLMKNDPTIDPAHAIDAYHEWGSEEKALIPVTIDGDEASHVFVGNITAPHRVDWVVDEFNKFLDEWLAAD